MATLAQIVSGRRDSTPLELWHLLSLDAPSVAVLWTWFVARASGISLPCGSLVTLFVCVWTLYVTDRLLDARASDRGAPASHCDTLEARHLFHHRHRKQFLAGTAGAAILLVWLVPRLDPATRSLYLLEGTLLAAWFTVLHATRSAHRLPKEWAVGVFFAAAVFIPTVARAPQLRIRLLPCAVLLAFLCSLNCLYIYRWEHESAASRNGQPPHATTRIGLRLLLPVSLAGVLCGLALTCLESGSLRSISLTCAASIALLILLDREGRRLQPIALRAAADLVLMLPLLYLPFLHQPVRLP